MRKIIQGIIHPILKKVYFAYNGKTRTFTKDGIELNILPNVFHPAIFFSTNLLIDYLKKLDLGTKKVLELGAGSGIISFYLAKHKNALSTASDISEDAIEGLHKNKEKTGIGIQILHSNLFDEIDNVDFDYIIINPPYYPKSAANNKEMAFYCGENYEYFEKLFDQLNSIYGEGILPIIIMILSEDCNFRAIEQIAKKNQFKFELKQEVKKRAELNFIYEIIRT